MMHRMFESAALQNVVKNVVLKQIVVFTSIQEGCLFFQR